MKTCSECDRPAKARGLCDKHYKRATSVLPVMPTRDMTADERFAYYSVSSPCGCVLWTGGTFGPHGYGAFWINGKTIGAHRYAYERAHGSIPAGLFVCHRCDEPRCVNPDHLFLGAPSANSRDMTAKARSARGERQGNSKLTDDAVRFIRATAMPGADVARMLGVSNNTITRVRLRKIWRHVA